MTTAEEASARLQREADFHDHLYSHDRKSRSAAAKYYSVLGDCRDDFAERLVRHAPGAGALELGCAGTGRAVALARAGAQVTAIDISEVAISKARANLPGNVDVELVQMDAEAMTFDDSSFDLVYGTGVLHHLDLDRALRGIARVLRPGGRALFLEPLGHNPAIKLYRRLTPTMRSHDEHPLLMRDFDRARHFFDAVDLDYYSLTTLIAVPLRATPVFEPLQRRLTAADRLLTRRVPYLGRFAWTALIEFTNRGEH